MILESIIVSCCRLSVLYHFVMIKYITLVENWLFCMIVSRFKLSLESFGKFGTCRWPGGWCLFVSFCIHCSGAGPPHRDQRSWCLWRDNVSEHGWCQWRDSVSEQARKGFLCLRCDGRTKTLGRHFLVVAGTKHQTTLIYPEFWHFCGITVRTINRDKKIRSLSPSTYRSCVVLMWRNSHANGAKQPPLLV